MASEGSEMLRLNRHIPWLWRTLKLLLLPIVLLIIFTTIFRYANPLFNQMFHSLDILIGNFLDWFAQYLAIGHLIFLLFTGALFTGIVYTGRHLTGLKIEKDRQDNLTRIRLKRKISSLFPFKSASLKDEYRTGILVFSMLNLLLLIVNTTEVFWLNGAYRETSAAGMSHHLHEGTDLLILSILLSMAIMLFLFRKNLNFYPKNNWLVIGALACIIQNGALGVNVALRNWYYISQYGLTYKRIGVFFFLLIVFIGLVFLWMKIF